MNGLTLPPSPNGGTSDSTEGAGEGDIVPILLPDEEAAWDAEDILCALGVSKPVLYGTGDGEERIGLMGPNAGAV
jgi:hypothetical protein